MNIGQAIKFCRQQKQLTQPVLAERAKLSASYLSILEKGKRDPSFSALQQIARALEVPLSLLVFLGTDPTEIEGMSQDIKEKLSAATLKLLMATQDAPQQSLL